MFEELIAILIVWGLAAVAWWGMHIAPIEYIDRAHKAEQRIVELETELAYLRACKRAAEPHVRAAYERYRGKK